MQQRYFPTRMEETLARHTDDVRGTVVRACGVIRREALAQLQHSIAVLDSLVPERRGHGYYVERFRRGYTYGHHGGPTGEGWDHRVQKDSPRSLIFTVEGLGSLCGRVSAAEDLYPDLYVGPGVKGAERRHLARLLAHGMDVPSPEEQARGRARFLEQVQDAVRDTRVSIDARVAALAHDRDLVRSPRLIDDLAVAFGEGARLGFARRRISSRPAATSPRTPEAFLHLLGALDGTFVAISIIAGGDSWEEPADAVTPGHIARAARHAAQQALRRGWEGDIGRLDGEIASYRSDGGPAATGAYALSY